MSSHGDSGTPFAPFVNKYAELVFSNVSTNKFQMILEKLSSLPTIKENFIGPLNYHYECDKVRGFANIVSAYASINEHTTNFQKVTLLEIISLSKDIQDYLGKVTNSGDDSESDDPEIISKALAAGFKPEDLNQLVKRAGDLVVSIVKFLQISLNDKENLQTSYEQSSTDFDEGMNIFLEGDIYFLSEDLFNLINITVNLQAFWVSVFSTLQDIKQDVDVALIKARASQIDYTSFSWTAVKRFGSLKNLIDSYNLPALIITSKAS